jgi:glycosyltransferase involved in cell wall biosynthesis
MSSPSSHLTPPAKPKRVCMIAYTGYIGDGRVRQEAETLVAWGHEVFFLVPKRQAQPRNYTLQGVQIRELNLSKYHGKSRFRYVLSYLAFVFVALLGCARLFFKTRLDVVHVHNMPNVLIFAGLVPLLFGRKLILDVHDTVLETYVAKFEKTSPLIMAILRLDEKICYSLAHKLICVNHAQRQALIDRGVPAGKIVTVITMPKFSNVSISKNGHHDSAFRMVNHGTMSKRLGNDLIIHATTQLIREIPGFELHIIGGGDNLDEVVRLSDSLGLQKHVHFHPSVPWDTLPEKLKTMDVGIVANRVNMATELMLPSKLIDFVVLDIPAIVPKLRAIEYYFSPDMVSYFEPENIDSMVEATIRLYKDAPRRKLQPLKARAFLDRYAWETAPDGLRHLYDSLFTPKDQAEAHRKADLAV